jgi:hypothetical protein
VRSRLQDANGTWSVQHTGTDPTGDGNPSGFIGLMVVVAAAAIGMTVWRVSTARRLARDAGLDPADATAITLFGNDGLDATYVASAVRSAQQRRDLPIPRARSTEDRLRELQRLHAQGLVTDEEYARRRSALVDTI